MGQTQRNRIRCTSDAAQNENERRREGQVVGYGKGTLEESQGRGKEGALRRRL